MCELKSWINKDGKIYHLTDWDLLDECIKKRLAGCKDNDYLGHGAIRKAYNIEGGAEHEEQDIWDLDKFPKEIADTLQHFDKYYSWQWEHCMQSDDLTYIILNGSEPWKEKACEQLIKQKPRNGDLLAIIRKGSEKLKEKAWEQLMKQEPSNGDLTYIICEGPKQWREKAWEQLLKQEPSNMDLRYMIYYSTKQWREKAWEQLMKQGPSYRDLICIIRYGHEPWQEKVKAELKRREG